MSLPFRLASPRLGRAFAPAGVAAVLFAASACRDAETVERLRVAEERVAAGETEADLLRAELESVRAERAALEAARREQDEAAKEKDEELDRVARHRDELTEWVQRDLLPLAEAQSPPLAQLRDATEEMRKEVARLRGLEWKHDVMRRRLSKGEAGEWARRDLKRDLPEEKARDLTAIGAEMGLVEPGTDLYAVVGEFIEGGAAAFYKPETRTFYHIEGNDGRGSYPIVFHELVHALEDQYFDLDAFYREIGEDTDAALARRGLVEGSASYFEGLYEDAHPEDVQAMMRAQMTAENMRRQQRMMVSVPPFLTASMGLYPYKNGKTWVEEMCGGDPRKVDALFADPPVSTEQVLHPEKFRDPAARDYPHRVAAPDLSCLPEAWRRTESDTMGELTTACLLAQLRFGKAAVMNLMDLRTQGLGVKEPAKTAVEGWDGDLVAAAVDPSNGRATVCWVSRWDSVQDAEEFVALYGVLLGGKVTGERPDELPSPVRYVEKDTGRVSSLVRDGARVVAVLGAAPEFEHALVEAGMQAKVEADPRDANDAK